MNTELDWSTRTTVAVIAGVGAMAMVPGGALLAANTQTVYPDVPENYWAQPFIQQLSQANILTGYPDGTFRPEQATDRDEYAAVIRQAFDAEAVRSIPEASEFGDVPEDYWAENAIEEAYETGFMSSSADNNFNPKSEINRADAVVALVQGLDLQPTAAVPAAAQAVQPKQMKNRLMFPLASTATMQLFAPVAPPPAADSTVPPSSDNENAVDLNEHYRDAEQIPDYARDEISLATQAGLLDGYLQTEAMFEPNRSVTRGETAALIYQALVYEDKMSPTNTDFLE